MDKQTVTRYNKRTRLHSFNQSGVSVPIPPPPVAADLQADLTATFEREILHLAHTSWAQDDANIHCSELATGQPLLSTYPDLESCRYSVPRPRTSACRVLFFGFRLQSFLSTKGFAQFALQDNEPPNRSDCTLTCERFGFQVAAVNGQMFTLMSHLLNVW